MFGSETILEPPAVDPWMIIREGFLDGLNPCALTAIVLFLIFLSITGKSKFHVLIAGSCFILGYLGISFLIVIGILDLAVGWITVQAVLRYLLFGLALAATALGIITTVDWWRYARHKDKDKLILKYPAVAFGAWGLEFPRLTARTFWGHPIIHGILWGIGAGVFGSLWPPNYVLASFHGGLYTDSDRLLSFFVLVVYEIFFLLPLILIFAAILYTVHSDKMLHKIQASLGMVKMASAGLLLGWGISSIYLFV